MARAYRLVAIEAVVGGGCTFVQAKDAIERFAVTSTSGVVQAAALAGFLAGSEVAFELEGTTPVVRRVAPFAAGRGGAFALGEYHVSRVATQRAPDGTEHLEVFLTVGNDPDEIAYNIFDPLLQPLLLAAFRYQEPGAGLGLHVQIDDAQVVAVRLGEPSASVERKHEAQRKPR